VTKPQAERLVKVLIISTSMALAENILECLGQFEAFTVLEICRNGVTGLKAIASQLPELVFIVAPLPDRMLGHVIKEAKKKHPGMRMVLVADWTEFAGFARANQKGADGFISARLLSRELPLVLAQYPQLAATWGKCFSPWKAGYGMA
jgi:DNA-binding NarL/FixJ family response regulator